jgi:biopolymer transport protein ExbD
MREEAPDVAFDVFSSDDDRDMAEINMTPLVDVMLVLLVIFMVTAPLFTHAVRIDLPRASSTPSADEPDAIVLSIDAAGAMRWNGAIVDEPLLAQRLAQAAAREPQPQLQLRADRATRYETVAALLSQVQRAGLTRLGLVTDPAQQPSR